MVIIYGKNNCVWCRKALDLCLNYGLVYQYKNISYDPKHKDEMLKLIPMAKTVPQIWWNGKHIGGYNEFATEIENTINHYGDGI